MRTLSLDLETYSPVNLASSGVYRYAEDPHFEILLFGYSIDSEPAHVIDLAQGETIPPIFSRFFVTRQWQSQRLTQLLNGCA